MENKRKSRCSYFGTKPNDSSRGYGNECRKCKVKDFCECEQLSDLKLAFFRANQMKNMTNFIVGVKVGINMKHDETKIEELKKQNILNAQAKLWEIQAKELHHLGEIKTKEFTILDTVVKQYAEHMVQQRDNNNYIKLCTGKCDECNGSGTRQTSSDYSPCSFCEGIGFDSSRYGCFNDFIDLIYKGYDLD